MESSNNARSQILASCLALVVALSVPVPAVAGTPQADADIKLVQTFLNKIRAATFEHHDPKEVRDVAERYMRPDYIQHSDGMKPGREGYIDSMVGMTRGGGPVAGPMPSPKDLYWVADSDKVIWVSSVQLPGKDKPEFMFNMMRIQDGKIAEHWGK
jgi:predicted SnoaL-like aldol condensation-catalyzing enzyme